MPINSNTGQKVAILLLGYNRPELIRKRICELGNVNPHKLIVSIDGGSGVNIIKQFEELKFETSISSQNTEFTIQETNLGLVRHITSAITKTLETYEYVIVIEDDVCLADNYVENILEGVTLNLGFRTATVGGFSPLSSSRNLGWVNSWRKTRYFSAWGWCVSRDIWAHYNHEISQEELLAGLQNSKSWNALSKYQQDAWMYRFKKIIDNPLLTWDYQMQFLTFKMDYEHVLPVFRISDNEGFSDFRSTNTKAARPRWMGSRMRISDSYIQRLSPDAISWVMMILDSLTIAGDSKAKELPKFAKKLISKVKRIF